MSKTKDERKSELNSGLDSEGPDPNNEKDFVSFIVHVHKNRLFHQFNFNNIIYKKGMVYD